MDFRVHPMPAGLTLATAVMPHRESVCVGVWIAVGGRHEPARQCGISHFIEHMLFKGTRQRSSRQISAAIEGVGGHMDAFTGNESTCFYAKAACRHLDTLLDVLGDMYRHARFDAEDVKNEQQVILEELAMYRDMPDQFVQEMLHETIWPNHPLGRLLTGTEQTITAMRRATLLQFKHRHYVSPNTVISIAGPVSHDEMAARVRKIFPTIVGRCRTTVAPAPCSQRAIRLSYLHRPVEQTQLAIGIRAWSRHDPRRYAFRLLSVLLGENTSSRLFQVVRERHGLAYAIQSSTSLFADTGALFISAGMDSKRDCLTRCLSLIGREFRKLSDHPPPAIELRRTKDYAIGQMRLGLESTTNQMNWLGDQLMAYGKITTPDTIEKRVMEVSADQIQAVASDLFRNHRLNIAIIAPDGSAADVTGRLTFNR